MTWSFRSAFCLLGATVVAVSALSPALAGDAPDRTPERALHQRVMVFIPERHLQAPVPDPAAETEFNRQLIEAGFKVIDRGRFAELRDQYREKIKDPRAAAEFGRKVGADILITGEAFSQRVGQTNGFISCRARVEVKAILVDTAQQLYADATDGGALDPSEPVAAKKALQRTAEKLAAKFVEKLMKPGRQDSADLQLDVSTFKTFTAAAKFEDALRRLPGVDDVHRESFDEGVLQVKVRCAAMSADQLGVLLEARPEFRPFGLSLKNVSKARLFIAVK